METGKNSDMLDTLYGNPFYVGQVVAFEGASNTYKSEHRTLLKGDPDTLAAREILMLQMRTAHAIRNNGYATAARNKYVTNASAIKINWKDKNGKKHSRMQDIWDEFASNPSLDGYGTLDNIQSVWHSSMFQSGQAFIRLQIRKNGNKNKIPLKLEVIPAEYHDIQYMGDKNFSGVRHGIAFIDTKPETYFFRKGIFDATWFSQENPYDLTAIPASELLHIFLREYPGQWIGIPKLSSVLIPLYEIDELIDATIAKQKAAQVISWIVKNTNPLNMMPVGAAINSVDKEGDKKLAFKTEGTNVQYLNKGEDISFYQSTDIGSNLASLINNEVRRIAAAVDVPYHQLTGDTSGLNFSSIRSIAIELRNRIEYVHHFCTIPIGLQPLASYFKSLAILYDNKLSSATPTFQLPRFYGVDELKDTQADLLEVQSGMATLQSKLDERHTTYEEIIEDAKRRKEELEPLGIVLTSDSANKSNMNNVQSNSNSTGE